MCGTNYTEDLASTARNPVYVINSSETCKTDNSLGCDSVIIGDELGSKVNSNILDRRGEKLAK